MKSFDGGNFMLYRKIESLIEEHLKSDSKKILLIDGARQIGKTYIINHVGKKLFENYIEINMIADSLGDRLFENTKTVEDFYLQVSMLAGNKMKNKENTLIFIDEIQAYPHLLTLLKFLSQDDKFTYIASGSLLGVTLSQTTSIPMGSIRKVRMFPLDFEEFLYANGMNELAISSMRKKFERFEALDESMHNKMMDLFRKFLLVGGLPDAVNTYLETKNIQAVRDIQNEIHDYYAADASKYDDEMKLKIRRIYDLIPSNMENKKKRIVVQSIENKRGKTFNNYADEFDYLISAGIALNVQAISNPTFPLIESTGKNLLKLYLNDVGILTGILYGNNIRAVLNDERSINLGSVYETVVASELIAHGHKLFYYDNRSKGEVDYLIDDYDSLSAVPIEVKSGKDYTVHSALNTFVQNEDYHIKKAFVVSNERKPHRPDWGDMMFIESEENKMSYGIYTQEGIKKGLIHITEDENVITYIHHNITRNYKNPEEKVQAEIFCKLVLWYKYPVEKIGLYVPVTDGSTKKQADIFVYNDSNHTSPLIVIECKKEDVSEQEFAQATNQAFSYAHFTAGTIKYVWTTSGIKNAYFKFDKESSVRETVSDIPQHGVKKLSSYKYAYNGGSTASGQQLFPLAKVTESELTNIFKQAHQALWGGGELNPSEAFDELDKLIFCKIFDEKKDRDVGEPYDFQVIPVEPETTQKKQRLRLKRKPTSDFLSD